MARPESHVPVELWAEILVNVSADSEYDKSTVKSFASTCRTFCDISRPRLCSSVQFHPYATDFSGAPLLPSPSNVDRLLQRLNFLCSAAIGPLVRYCSICVQLSYIHGDDWSFATDSPYVLLDALLERLVRFTHLQRLRASHVRFTQARVDILCRLQHIPELHIFRCTVVPGEQLADASPSLHVSDFTLDHDQPKNGADYWIPLLHPDQLRILHTALEPCFVRAARSIASFLNVHTLAVATHNTTLSSPQNLAIMSRFPAVRILKVWGKELDTSGIVQAALPHLEQYHGPYRALSSFLAANTLKRIQTKCFDPKHLLNRIPGIQGHKITAFHVEFRRFDNATFNKIVELLPNLTELLLTLIPETDSLFESEIPEATQQPDDHIVEGLGHCLRSGFVVSNFFLELADSPFLPPCLERLAISWECYDEFSEALCTKRSTYKLPDFRKLRDALVARCPGLTWLWLCGIYYLFEWRDPNPYGAVKEYIETNLVLLQRQLISRERPDIFHGSVDM
ncbi:hypothetical protein B0H14DRAFT_3527604 [Mycena olivaceomarginata]|nr:hypothetical protein B0H14DRAFT_3527604 [Mycena olivaceomarginata]